MIVLYYFNSLRYYLIFSFSDLYSLYLYNIIFIYHLDSINCLDSLYS